jgi:hypothetical protein
MLVFMFRALLENRAGFHQLNFGMVDSGRESCTVLHIMSPSSTWEILGVMARRPGETLITLEASLQRRCKLQERLGATTFGINRPPSVVPLVALGIRKFLSDGCCAAA